MVEWASGVPILIVCTARPELVERRPGWGGGKLNATTLSLSPLTEADTSRLLAALLERPLLPAEDQQELLVRAGGNPLYAEQYAQMLLEGAEAESLPIPESVQGIIAARLDRLAVDEKSLLQDAAVLGKVFWLGGLTNGRTPREAEEALHALERKGFVQRARSSSVADESEYSFLHLLVRDVAYAQIPRADRAEKHRHAAEWIESLGRPQDNAEMLAHHYSTALELARASGQPTEHLAERGRLVLREAGDRAMALNAFEAAARSYASALELWPLDDPDRPRLLLSYGTALAIGRESGDAELAEAAEGLVALGDRDRAAEAEILLADGHWRGGRRDDAYEHIDRAVALLEDAHPSRAKARVLSEVSRYHMLAERNEEAIETGREALAMAIDLGLEEVKAHALNNIGSARIGLGDLAGLGDLQMSIAISNEIGSVEVFRGYNNLFANGWTTGNLDQAAEAVSAAFEAADRLGNPGAARWPLFQRVHAAFWQGHWDESLKIVEKTLADVGPTHALSRWAYEARGRIRLARDDVAGAVLDAERNLELGRQAKDPQTVIPALAFAARAFFEAGREEDAARLLDELLEQEFANRRAGWPTSDLPWIFAALGRSSDVAEHLKATTMPTRWSEAAAAILEGDLLGAAQIFADIGHLPGEADARLRAAEQLVAEGRRAEADEQLRKALAFYKSVGATRHIREGEALLAASA